MRRRYDNLQIRKQKNETGEQRNDRQQKIIGQAKRVQYFLKHFCHNPVWIHLFPLSRFFFLIFLWIALVARTHQNPISTWVFFGFHDIFSTTIFFGVKNNEKAREKIRTEQTVQQMNFFFSHLLLPLKIALAHKLSVARTKCRAE